MKKRLLSITLSLALTGTLLAGCSGGTTPTPTPVAPTPTPVVATTNDAGITIARTGDVQRGIKDENTVIVDARSASAYLGWLEDGMSRNGHIRTATDFSADWLTCTYSDTDNLEKETREQVLEGYLASKGITPDKNVIIYDAQNGNAEATEVAKYFQSKGINNVSVYGVNEWEKDLTLKMDAAPNYQLLVPAWEVKNIVDGKAPEVLANGVDWQIFDVAWGEVDQSGYLDGHVPGAVHVNTDWFEPEELNWMLDSDANLLALMLRLGITADSHIIVTGPEPMASCRFAIICMYMGVTDVYVMNGGLVGWKDAGYDLQTENVEAIPVESFGVDTPANPDLIDTIQEVQDLMAQSARQAEELAAWYETYPEAKESKNGKNAAGEDPPQGAFFTLVDNRTWEEFIGESTGYSYHDKAGRIEGAVFGYAGKLSSSSMCYYRNINKTMRSFDEILALWAAQGIDADNMHLSFMCGSGWRAAEVMWYARVMGYENVSLFSDGWIGWSNAGLPSVTGEPEAPQAAPAA